MTADFFIFIPIYHFVLLRLHLSTSPPHQHLRRRRWALALCARASEITHYLLHPQPSTAARQARPEAQTGRKLINKHLKVSFTSERAHASCADDTRTDCVVCFWPRLRSNAPGYHQTLPVDPSDIEDPWWLEMTSAWSTRFGDTMLRLRLFLMHLNHLFRHREASGASSQEKTSFVYIWCWFASVVTGICSGGLRLEAPRLIKQFNNSVCWGGRKRRTLVPPRGFRLRVIYWVR